MMKATYCFFVFMLLLFSCNQDDDAGQNRASTLNGSWSLVNVSGGFAGVNDAFQIGTITWDFNQNTLELTVTNTNTANVIFDGLPSGTYDYELLTPTDEDASLVINTLSYSIRALSSSQLVLDEGIAFDGFLLSFSR